MYPLCFPPPGWWALVLPTFTLLLLAVRDTTARQAFYLGLAHGLIAYGIALSWLLRIFAAGALPLFAIIALFTALFCLLFHYTTRGARCHSMRVLAAAVLWTAIEFYRCEWFVLRFAWITPGTALGPTVLSPVAGAYAMSFLVLAASAALVFRTTRIAGAVLALIVLCLGLVRPARLEPEKDGITVTLVQSEACSLHTYLALTRQARGRPSDVIVWPEYALPYDVRRRPTDFATLTNLCAEMDAILVTGTKTIVGTGPNDWYNTALVLDRHGVVGEYYKARPVHFFIDGRPGRSFHPLRTPIGSFATPICFDCDYTEVLRRMAEQGARYFLVPSFDSASWSVKQHLQHAALFRLRAAENARWLACAASSGVSQVIDPHGVVHASIPPMTTGVITYRIDANSRPTFFTRFGWLFPWLTMGGTAVLVLLPVIRRMRTKGKGRT